MQITQVDLENFKSYQQTSVRFTPGTNAICGHNGAGKSTLLEAIGFAVFGYAPYKQDHLVREGENTASVTVHVQANDGREYQVVRKCGSYTQHYVYDPELDQKLVEGVGDSTDWLRDFLGVDETGDLSTIFRDAVGVQQGTLTAAFLQRPGDRKNIFNPLLRVDEYEEIWENLLEPKRQLEQRIQESKEAIAGFKAKVERLPEWDEKVSQLQSEIDDNERSKVKTQANLNELNEQKENLESMKEDLDELERLLLQSEADVEKVKTRQEENQKLLKEGKNAQTVVEETQSGHQAYESAQTTLKELEQSRKERDHLKDQRQEHETALALAKQKVENLESELEKVSAAEKESEQLQPQVEQQYQLEKELELAKRDLERMEETLDRLAELKADLRDLKSKCDESQQGLEKRAEREDEIAALNSELEKLEQQNKTLSQKISEAKAEEKQIIPKINALESSQTANCPVCEEPLTAEHREDLLARYQSRQNELESVLEDFNAKVQANIQEKVEQKDALCELEESLKKLPLEREVEELMTRIEKQQVEVQKESVILAELGDVPEMVAYLESELSKLGNPKNKFQRLSAIIEQRDELDNKLAVAAEEVVDQSAQFAALGEDLSTYNTLDEELTNQQKALKTHEAGHQRYLEHIRSAETLPKREKEAQALQDELAAVQDVLSEKQKEHAQVVEDYDAEEYEKLMSEYDQLRDQLVTLKERLAQQEKQINEAQIEIQQLRQVQEQLEESLKEQETLEKTLNLLTFMRHLLRDAGPEITRRLVDLISMEADRLYADIMQNYSTRLRWAEDYDIILYREGRERTFPQLSGGEEMSAALAVRLALLREVTGIDIAFFDEPTANLDEQRRVNLAEQILNVKGFSQLFVISHDDTFEQGTDNIVHVIKENGISRVEA